MVLMKAISKCLFICLFTLGCLLKAQANNPSSREGLSPIIKQNNAHIAPPFMAPCDISVEGLMVYCNSFLQGNGNNTTVIPGYFVGFRVKSKSAVVLNVVNKVLGGTVPINSGKHIDDIENEVEPGVLTTTPLSIAGTATDSIEYWYFGPFANGDSFNIVLVDPTMACDTINVGSGRYSCVDGQPHADPMACDAVVPSYFLDFSKTAFEFGGGDGINENLDEIFLIMQRNRESSCCGTQPEKAACFEFIVKLAPNDIGIVVDDVGNGSPGGSLYGDSIVGNNMCPGSWPVTFTQPNGQVNDLLPLCLAGKARDWVILSCKPGGNITSATIDAVSAPLAPPKTTIQPCDIKLEVFNADTAYWSSPDDPGLDNFDSCSADSTYCNFIYNPIFGPVLNCEGDTFMYIVGAKPQALCYAVDTILYDTTFVVVYPVFNVQIDTFCTEVPGSIQLTATVSSPAVGCNYTYLWSNGATTPSITVPADGTQYIVTVKRDVLDVLAAGCVVVSDTVLAFPKVTVDCSQVTDQNLECITDLPSPDLQLISIESCGGNPLLYVHHLSNGKLGCIGDTLVITRQFIVDFDGDTLATTVDRDTCFQYFKFVDKTAPKVECIPSVRVACLGDTTVQTLGTPIGVESCHGPSVFITHKDTKTPNCGSTYTVARKFYVADICGNVDSTCVQAITIYDEVPPSITCPSDRTINCPGDTTTTVTGVATATDACNGSAVISYTNSITIGSCPGAYTLNRTWKAVDACTNSATCIQKIVVQDTTRPTIICPPNEKVSTEENISDAAPDINDTCDPEPSFDFEDTESPGLCEGSYIINRTYTVTDACGNTNTCLQIIDVNPGCVVDLELSKTLATGNSQIVTPGQLITFTIQVTNTGDVPVDSLSIVDYIPQGFVLADTDWTAGMAGSTGQSASVGFNFGNDSLSNGQTVSIDITLQVLPNAMSGNYINNAEITSMFDAEGTDISEREEDSTPDDDDTNDVEEDDFDSQPLCILPTPVIAGDQAVCPGDEVTYALSTPYNDANTYTWALSGGGVIVENTDSTVTIKWNEDAGGNFIITVKESAGSVEGCTGDTTLMVHVNTNATMVCIDQINLSLDGKCESVVTFDMILPGVDSLDDNYEIILYDLNNKVIPNALVTKAYVGKKIKVSVINKCNLESCWGYIFVEDKLGPTITVPQDVMVYCTESTLPPRTGQATATDCGGIVRVNYRDHVVEIDKCVDGLSKIITRTWIATDEKGNTATATQIITVKAFDDKILLPPVAAVDVPCGAGTSPAEIATALGVNYGYPHYINFATPSMQALHISYNPLSASICNVGVTYEDGPKIIGSPHCKHNTSFIRKWKIVNWCTGSSFTFIQWIKIVDNVAPAISVTAPSQSLSLGNWSCEINIVLPEATVNDACDNTHLSYEVSGPSGFIIEKRGNKWHALNVPKGSHTFTYTATDCAGNTRTKNISINVVDKVSPVAIAKEYITVSLTNSGNVDEAGIAKLTPDHVNNGSYDNCGKIYMEVRRMDMDAPSCLNEGEDGYNNNVTYNGLVNGLNQNTPLHEGDSIQDTDKGQFVKFCCEDIGNLIKVSLRVWDDADMDGVFGSEGDNYNETWANVRVEDKSIPTITCSNVEKYCDEGFYYQATPSWETYVVHTKVDDSAVPLLGGLCTSEYVLEFRDKVDLQACKTGHITRTWRIKGTNITCDQTIHVRVRNRTAVLDFPLDVHEWNKCTLTEADVLNFTLRSTLPPQYGGSGNGIEVQKDASGKPLLYRNNYQNTGCELIGRNIQIEDYQIGEGCKKWLVTFKYINWCDFSSAGSRTTIFKFLDKKPPIINTAMADTVRINANCVADWVPKVSGTDEGGCDFGLQWEARLWHEGKTIIKTGTGANPSFKFVDLVKGTHTLTYKVTDGCGNYTEKIVTLVVLGKAPTPYCHSLSSAVMVDGSVEVWAKDFDRGATANCADPILYFTFNSEHPVVAKLAEVHFFKGKGILATEAEYKNGLAQKWLPTLDRGAVVGGTSGRLFGCKVGDGSTYPVSQIRATVWDKDLRGDYCVVTLSLVDNQNTCTTQGLISISGKIKNESGIEMSNVDVYLKSNLAGYPLMTKTNAKGEYTFSQHPTNVAYKVAAKKDGDDMNGVSTLDLIEIQRHILGVKKLDSPYKMIAGDINGDRKLKVDDLVELRKLILGVATEFKSQDSWLFIDGNQTLSDDPWPYQTEMLHIEPKVGEVDRLMGIKVGDVQGTANANARTSVVTPRSSGIKLSITEQDLEVGEVVDVIIHADKFNEVYGMQFTASIKGMELVKANGLEIDLVNNQVASPKKGALTLSWASKEPITLDDHAALISLQFKVTEKGKLSDKININSSITPAESYIGEEMDVRDVSLDFEIRGANNFTLYQNEPNPWKNETVIKYELPESGSVNFTVMDIAGKVISTSKLNGLKGMNIVKLTENELQGKSGILLYQIEGKTYKETKKMIIIE
jgi:uncharacterized repeat protein (TIGR01451 family)